MKVVQNSKRTLFVGTIKEFRKWLEEQIKK